MVSCRICKWCFKEITDDFVVTNEWEFLHIECYREVDKVLEESKKNNEIVN